MDSSAPKRRKTSPTTSVPVGGATAPAPSDASARRPARRHMPSFASPTKASLARSNPDVLERMNAGPRARRLNDTPASAVGSSTGNGDGSDPARAPADSELGNGDARHIRSDSAGQPGSSIRRATGAMASRPRRTPNRPSPRPLPPPSAEEEELINPFRGRVLRRSPLAGVPVPEEPELPPTPTQKGISDPASVHTSPIGIHNTPSKRPRRSRALAERIKSSPLKQPPLHPPELTRELTPVAAPSRVADRLAASAPRDRKRKRKPHPARNVEELDALAEKKALRDSLLAEVGRLKSDLELAGRANDRIYQQQQASRDKSAPSEPEDKDGLLDLLRRHALPPEQEPAPRPSQDWLEAALNPISLLPFSKPDLLLPPLLPPQKESAHETEKPPTSHHPVPMTAEEELPYLQVFTPLAFASTMSILPRDDTADGPGPLLQRHAIAIASTPPGLFVARVEMTVNTKSLAIVDLRVPHLDPAAVNELGPLAERIIRGAGSSALARNIGVLTWAMGEWLRVAVRRARFWHAVQKDLGGSEGLARCAREMREVLKKGVTRTRPPRDEEDEDNSENEGGAEPGNPQIPLTKADLLPYMGKTDLDLELADADGAEEAPSIRIRWRIEFDWTGEAQSKMGLLVSAPTKWHGHDTRSSLGNIPDVFDKLVKDNKDPMMALRTVVALLVGEGR
ncbi:hypothetical protein GGS23DRAFT_394578 [Durotheca rogersii]|uniref:uncharacterized protein n=1 Tax=Durotheca rogersii TaxID=419775 RepID=UPI00221E7C9A|nr:uncharacterized protein GGS23DRAFT_394578 [Durotheca rogersii]KAI5856674.1 hypothetical protein GGS23DRAFT_394578 [Durotheca rogersii]